MSWTVLLPVVSEILDRVMPDEKERTEAKLKVLEMAQTGEKLRADIVKSEASSEHWLTAAWRPITMVTFVILIICRWFGLTSDSISEAEYVKLWNIVEIGLGGYVIGRTVEKITPTITDAFRKK